MMRLLARWIDCTEGQAWTVTLGLVVGLWAVSAGLPPVLEPRPLPPAAAGPADPDVEPDQPADPSTPAPTDDVDVDQAPEADVVVPPLAVAPPPGTDAGTPPLAESPPGDEQDDPPFDRSELPVLAAGQASLFARIPPPGAPHAIAQAADGRVFVATDNAAGRGEDGPPVVFALSPDGHLLGQVAVPMDGAARTHGLVGLAVGPGDRLVAVDTTNARILDVDIDAGTVEVIAVIPDVPVCIVPTGSPCQPGVIARPPVLRGVAADDSGRLFVADAGQGTIWQVDADGTVAPWRQADEWLLAAPPEGGLTGIALDDHGDVVVAVASSLADGNLAHGVIERVARTAAGEAGNRVEIARTEPGSVPTGVAVDDRGRLHVTLAGHDAVVTLSPDGTEVMRVGADDTDEQTGVPLDRPAGLMAHRGGLLVVTGSSATDPDRWAILRIGLPT